jgi:hypothetical protein
MGQIVSNIGVDKFMILLKHTIVTKVRDNEDLKELRRWLMVNVGTPYKEWRTFINNSEYSADGRYYVGVHLRTEEQATMVALRWS